MTDILGRLDDFVPDDSDWIPAEVADKFVAQMREECPNELAEWLDEHAPLFFTNLLSHRLRSKRGAVRAYAKRSAFREASQRHEEGDEEAFDHFGVVYCVADDNTRRKVSDMTGEDHLYVANHYQRSARVEKLLEAFHRAVAKTLGPSRTTSDVFTVEKYDELFRSIVKP